jgi:hypothetical protein
VGGQNRPPDVAGLVPVRPLHRCRDVGEAMAAQQRLELSVGACSVALERTQIGGVELALFTADI